METRIEGHSIQDGTVVVKGTLVLREGEFPFPIKFAYFIMSHPYGLVRTYPPGRLTKLKNYQQARRAIVSACTMYADINKLDLE